MEALRRNPAEFYARQFAQVHDAASSIACGHPQADNITLLAFTDALAEFYVFSPGSDWQGCMDGALAMAVWALGNATGSEGGDTDLKAIQFLAEWLAGSRIHFDDCCENDRLERWGAIEDKACEAGFLWYVFSSALSRAATSTGRRRLGAWPRRAFWCATRGTATRSRNASARTGESTASASTTRRWRCSWSGRTRALRGRHRVSRRRAMMRRGLRRQYRLVRVEVRGRHLNVITGTRNKTAPCAGARARTGARGVWWQGA